MFLYCRWDLNPHTPITRLMTVYKTGAIRQYVFQMPGTCHLPPYGAQQQLSLSICFISFVAPTGKAPHISNIPTFFETNKTLLKLSVFLTEAHLIHDLFNRFTFINSKRLSGFGFPSLNA